MINNKSANRCKVGELRPSQVLTTFGIGSIVDLPNLSVMVMGLTKDLEKARLIEDFRDWRQEVRESNQETFRWLFEEYRVSVFAQELGTAQPVSVKRLEALIG